MARTVAKLSEGGRITDYISLGVVAKVFPRDLVEDVLKRTGRTSARQRDLPAHVAMYYVIAMTFYMEVSYREVLRCLLEGIQWLKGLKVEPKVAVRSSISQARIRLGWEPVRQLHDEVVHPIATKETKGAWFRQWQVVSLDGSTLDVPDEAENAAAFGRQAGRRGTSAFPTIRFLSLVENGTHVLFGSRMGPYATGELTLAEEVVPLLKPGMLCLADRGFYGFRLWGLAKATGAELVWRIKKVMVLPRETELKDGSYLSRIYPGSVRFCRNRAGRDRFARIPTLQDRSEGDFPSRNPRGRVPVVATGLAGAFQSIPTAGYGAVRADFRTFSGVGHSSWGAARDLWRARKALRPGRSLPMSSLS